MTRKETKDEELYMSVKRVRDMPIGSYFVVKSIAYPQGMSMIRAWGFDFIEHVQYILPEYLLEYQHILVAYNSPFMDNEVIDWFEETGLPEPVCNCLSPSNQDKDCHWLLWRQGGGGEKV